MDNTSSIEKLLVDKLNVEIYSNRELMGAAAAHAVAEQIRLLIRKQGAIRMVFASAPSQDEFLENLNNAPDIDWSKVTAFHMDEYIGIDSESPQSFGYYIRTRLWENVPLKQVHYINPTAADPQAECARYAKLISERPVDIVCMGIGENGHIAFNDPPVADFNDPQTVKVVELEQKCRQQQVNDGCFPTIEAVPKTAITLTVSALLSGKKLIVIVPGPTKTQAVFDTLYGPIDTSCPASILRKHDQAVLYLDPASADKITK